ncbi:endolytic transglycosylase MltG [Gallaecimonas kandeliae]|uniref:endolytic transglycosylase MltG n=1 Tax=Gallaecimonas kandeliae TaxID=3029055 RepID=UPI002649A34F|nr:endolytic transglycosylase MltG [Gallaecimonas kandeliae]WKE67386.1 endolytic transglycosylase MltG [Gallaecimonas kandeliae]
MKKLFWITALLLSALGALLLTASWQYRQALKMPLALDAPRTLELTPGTSARHLIKDLNRQGLIKEGWPYRLLLKLEPDLAQIRAGCYELTPGMTAKTLLQDAAAGREQSYQVTLVDGERFSEWQQRLADAPHLAGVADEQELAKALGLAKLEGWLMPDTYQYRCGDTEAALLERAHKAMAHYLEVSWEGRDKGLPFESPYQALILASIVEKETALPAERPLIASVFINRLQKGMRLQTDPTVIYGLGDSFDGNLTRAHLKQSTPYNTYVIKGLPPTPIAMPSRAAILAVLHPAKADYLYFVAKGDGSHVFSKTLREHNNAVNRYQRGRG